MELTIHVYKLYREAQQHAIPGREAAWVARKIIGLKKAGKLVGFTRSPSGDWVKITVEEIPAKLQLRGVSPEKAAEISAAFWRMLSEETR